MTASAPVPARVLAAEQRADAIAANKIAAALTERWGFVRFRLQYEIAHDAIERAKPSPRLAKVLAEEDVPPRVLASEKRRERRERMSRGSLGCPRHPGSCGHMLVDHAGEDGWDDTGQPVNPRCQVLGCDCEGTS